MYAVPFCFVIAEKEVRIFELGGIPYWLKECSAGHLSIYCYKYNAFQSLSTSLQPSENLCFEHPQTLN